MMDMIATQDLISLFLTFCGGISIIGAAAVYIAKAVGWIRRPEHKQDEMLQDHEKRISELEEKTENDYSDIKKLQEEMAMMLRAVMALVTHSLDGNNKDELKDSKKEINSYLQNMIKK